jgi:hypothetical protein
MQTVHVLGQKKLDPACPLEPGQSAMRVIGPGLMNAPPADEAARPIAPARLFLAHEGLVGHRLRPLPLAVGVAIVRNPRPRAAASAGQDEEAPMPVDEVREAGVSAHLVEPVMRRGIAAASSYKRSRRPAARAIEQRKPFK